MIKFKSGFTFILILLSSMLLSSCLTINRNIKINQNGSGEETIKIIFQKQFYDMMASMSSLMDSSRRQGYLDSLYSDEFFMSETKNKYDSISGLKLLSIANERGLDSSNTITVKYSFDSVKNIGKAMESLNEEKSKSITVVNWDQIDNRILFEYFYEESPDATNEMSDSAQAEIRSSLSKMFENGSFNLTIDFPYDVISSNATSQNGNILHWDYTMSEVIMKGRMKLEAVLSK